MFPQAMFAVGNVNKHLTDDQWRAISRCTTVLKPFAEAQTFLDGDKFVSLSYIPTIVTSLRRHLDKVIYSRTGVDAVQQAAHSVAIDFYTRYFGIVVDDPKDVSFLQTGFVPQSALLAAVCDPRTKFLKGIGSTDAAKAKHLLKERMSLRQEEQAKELTAKAATAAEAARKRSEEEKMKDEKAGSGEGVEGDEESSQKNYLQCMLADLESFELAPESDEGVENHAQADEEVQILHEMERRRELSTYFKQESCPAIGVDEDPLGWWKENEFRFPLIAHVARCVLATPATSAPSQSLFSQAGVIVSARRTRLSADRLEQLMFLRGSWVAAEDHERGKADSIKEVDKKAREAEKKAKEKAKKKTK